MTLIVSTGLKVGDVTRAPPIPGTSEYVRKVVADQRDHELGAANRHRAEQQRLAGLAQVKAQEAQLCEAKAAELDRWLESTAPCNDG